MSITYFIIIYFSKSVLIIFIHVQAHTEDYFEGWSIFCDMNDSICFN